MSVRGQGVCGLGWGGVAFALMLLLARSQACLPALAAVPSSAPPPAPPLARLMHASRNPLPPRPRAAPRLCRYRQAVRDLRERGIQFRLHVRHTGTSKGLGLYALQRIPAGTQLMEYVGEHVPNPQVRS